MVAYRDVQRYATTAYDSARCNVPARRLAPLTQWAADGTLAAECALCRAW